MKTKRISWIISSGRHGYSNEYILGSEQSEQRKSKQRGRQNRSATHVVQAALDMLKRW